ncbi:MAG TPA: DUF488 domain-containing protein [Thermodesulfovibrionales bacterium]|nr:DUF488 domain-containing protein [Thermodesulfovibrionales bacterium]
MGFPPDLSKKIFTLGTGRRSEEDFIEILLALDIEVLIDVRRVPRSKNPAFHRANLERLLKSEGIGYNYLGDELGGLRKGGYIGYLLTEDFKRGVDTLESLAAGKRSVIFCAEKLPWKCHRKWISRELHKRGWLVEHIIDKDKIWAPK